jgi:hypothetical protein
MYLFSSQSPPTRGCFEIAHQDLLKYGECAPVANRSLQEGPKQASTFAVSVTFIVITSLVVALRFYVRFRLIEGGLGLDDRK